VCNVDSDWMRLVRLLFRVSTVVLMALGLSVSSQAEPIFPDGLFDAYLQAGASIAAGEDRGETVARLRQAIEKHPQSIHRELATRLANDLAESITRAEARIRAGRTLEEAPAEFLSETQLPLFLLWTSENGDRPLAWWFMKGHPRDPAVLLLRQERKCIDQLLLQLDNDSPTRAFDMGVFSGIPHVPRVSDVALTLIETVSQCSFRQPGSPPPNKDAEKQQRPELIEHISKWWRENKEKSVAEGIRAQIPHGDGHSMLTMAKNLIRVTGDASPQDREHGLEVMRRIARGADYTGAPAAEELAKYGDLSPVEWYYDEFKRALGVPGREWGHTIWALWYLAKHGGRREWELIYEIAARGRMSVLGSLINSRSAQTSPYAIPLLGMALNQTSNSGSRWINEKVGGQSFSKADQATEYLQKQTGIEFGYRVDGTPAERAAAIERAQKWWSDEGKAKYTFDYIEKNLINPAAR
jgi:hypothetical protein